MNKMSKDTDFYDKESSYYSVKRYPDIISNYIHYLFRRRLEILKLFILSIKKNNGILVEMGCADGYVIRELYDSNIFSGVFIGIDISESMINVARKSNKSSTINFYLRNSEPHDIHADILVEIGVLNFTNLNIELEYARNHIVRNGYYIVSFTTKTSLFNLFKPSNVSGYSHLESLNFYKKMLYKDFLLVDKVSYGLFVPYLWKMPRIAKIVQPLIDRFIEPFLPSIFHETIYLLRKK